MSKSFVLGYTRPYVLFSASWQALFPVWERGVCLAALGILAVF